MKLLCRLGLHRWKFKDKSGPLSSGTAGFQVDTFAKCCRPGCTRYPEYNLVNRECRHW